MSEHRCNTHARAAHRDADLRARRGRIAVRRGACARRAAWSRCCARRLVRRSGAPGASARHRGGHRAALRASCERQLRRGQRVLPARQLHDEVQPQDRRVGVPAARASRAPIRISPRRPSRALLELMCGAAGVARRDRGSAGGDASACRRRARRADRAPDDSRVPHGQRRSAQARARSRLGARHQPGDGRDVRLRGRAGAERRARGRGPRRACAAARHRRGRDHAHEPEHARPVRREHPRDHRGCARGRRAGVLRRRQPERHPRASRARATWASTRCTSTSTRRSPRRTAAAGRAQGPCAVTDALAPFLPGPVVGRGRGRRASRS